jgi:hypothetical protein
MNVTFTVTAKSLGERPATSSHRADPSADGFGIVFEGTADATATAQQRPVAALPGRGQAAADEAAVAADPIPMGREGGRTASADMAADDGSDAQGLPEPRSDDAATTGRSSEASPHQEGGNRLSHRQRQSANHEPDWKDRRSDHDQGDGAVQATVTPAAPTAVVVQALPARADAPPPQTKPVTGPTVQPPNGAPDMTAKASRMTISPRPMVANQVTTAPVSDGDRQMMPPGKGNQDKSAAASNTAPDARPQPSREATPRPPQGDGRIRFQDPPPKAFASGIGSAGGRTRDGVSSAAPARAATAQAASLRSEDAAPPTPARIGSNQPSDASWPPAVGSVRVERHLPPLASGLVTSTTARVTPASAGFVAAAATGLPASTDAPGAGEHRASAPTDRIESRGAPAPTLDTSSGPDPQAVVAVAGHASSEGSHRRDRATDRLGAAAPASQGGEKPTQAAITPAGTAAPDSPTPTGSSSLLATSVASGIAGAISVARATDADAAPLPQPVQSITLSLDTRDYGQIDVRVTLKGNAVSVHLKAERAETADSLARDDAVLRGLLHKAGYDTQQIQVDKREAPPAGDGATSGGQQTAGTGTGTSFGHAASDQRAATPDQRTQLPGSGDAFALPGQETQDVPHQDRYRGTDRLYV